MRVTWVQPEDLLAHELRQAADEGRAVGPVAARWTAAGGEARAPHGGASQPAAPAALRTLARELLDELALLPVDTALAAAEPEALPHILAAAAPVPSLPPVRGGAAPGAAADRLLGGWRGRAAGCLLGKPVEKIPRAGIREILEATGRWPLADYFTARGLPGEVSERWPWNRASRSTSLVENIDGMPEDDDLNYPLLGLLLLERHGEAFTEDDVAQLWLTHLPGGRVFTAERAAYRNLLDGYSPPECATYRNPFREWIGAQIRGDVYGWARPGDPRGAAALAWRDARISHTRNGIYGAMYAAALVSAACVADDVDTVLDAGLSVLPADSRLAHAIRFARNAAAEHPGDVEAAVDELYDAYGDLHWVHVLPNAALLTLALAASGGDYQTGICTVVAGGWDTDSNGATAGSVLGTLLGAHALPERWIAPLRDRLSTSLPGMNELSFTDLAARTLAVSTAAASQAPDARPLVAVVGSANMDLVADCAALPRPGETVLGGTLRTVPGGKGANQAVAAARSGAARVAFLGAVGADEHGRQIRNLLRADGIDTALLRETSEAPTGTALITVDSAAENCIVVVPGANATLGAPGESDLAILKQASVVLAQLEISPDAVTAAFAAARGAGATTVLNAAPVLPLPAGLLAVTDLLLVNQIEAAHVAGHEDEPEKLCEELLRLVPRVAMTLGERGALYAERGGAPLRIAAPRAAALDTTAAGDTFAGVLAAGLAAGEPVEAVLRLACAAASLTVEVLGASTSIPDARSVEERYVAAYGTREGRA
ncbi:MAG TPA: PfkB family carbohydrate kinase [Actinocrinis sp.]|nr:PfkB family carbohydrate kinase [Actinocrinis sp.]